jgi:quinol monooxygenase YgiN
MADKPVTVIVRLRAKPGMEGRVRQELYNLLRPTRAEKGCINYDMHETPNDPSLFLFHENWASEEDLKRHLEAPHIKRWIEEANVLLAEPLDLTLWKKVDVEGSNQGS